MEVAIIGAGIAGLVCAHALRAQGHSCSLYERRNQAAAHGMGFVLGPNVLENLRHLTGENRDCIHGMDVRRFSIRDADGMVLKDVALPPGTRGVRRIDLITWLQGGLADHPIEYNAEISQWACDTSGPQICACLLDGRMVRAQLFVAADGALSCARRSIFPHHSLPLARVQEIVGCAQRVRMGGDQNAIVKFQCRNGGLAFGILPVSPHEVVWYLQFDSLRFTPPRAHEIEVFVRCLLGGWTKCVDQVLEQSDFGRVHHWRPLDLDVVPHFYHNNLVLIGDAAHPLSPFISQGVASAVDDAIALTQSLSQEPILPQALARYDHLRRPKCVQMIKRGRQIADQFVASSLSNDLILPLET